MLSKCLNPQCTAKFRYLGDGRLFRIDFSEVKRRKSALASRMPELCTVDHPSKPEAGLPGTPEKERPVEHFWLCANCAASLTVKVSDTGEVEVVKLPIPQEPVGAEPPDPKLMAAS